MSPTATRLSPKASASSRRTVDDLADAGRALERAHRLRGVSADSHTIARAVGQHRERHVEVIEVRIAELERRHRELGVALEPARGVGARARPVAEQHAAPRQHHGVAAFPRRAGRVAHDLVAVALVEVGARGLLALALGMAQPREQRALAAAALEQQRRVLHEHRVVRAVHERQHR